VSLGRLIFCCVAPASPELLERLGVAVEVVRLDAARDDPLAFQSRAAAADLVVSAAEIDEEVRALCGDFADVVALPAGAK
jgi:hypothetical protein